MTRYFYTEVETQYIGHSNLRAQHIAQQYGEVVEKAGGVLNVGLSNGEDYAVLMLELPDDTQETPETLIPDQPFHVARVAHLPTVEDHGIR